MGNPSDLLSDLQKAACAKLGVTLDDLDHEFWNKIERIEADAFIRTAIELRDLAPAEFEKIQDDISLKIDGIKNA